MSSLLSVMLTCRCCPHSLSVGARGRALAVGLVQPNGLGRATLGRRDLYTSTLPFRGPFPSAVRLPVGINRLPDVEFLNLSYQKSWVSLLPSDELLPPQLAFHGQSPGGGGLLGRAHLTSASTTSSWRAGSHEPPLRQALEPPGQLRGAGTDLGPCPGHLRLRARSQGFVTSVPP